MARLCSFVTSRCVSSLQFRLPDSQSLRQAMSWLQALDFAVHHSIQSLCINLISRCDWKKHILSVSIGNEQNN